MEATARVLSTVLTAICVLAPLVVITASSVIPEGQSFAPAKALLIELSAVSSVIA